ncbi:glycine betaine ABC transporter substrate-binding protein [Robertmurraya korlensis]|uniref:glycine betaine ABC transporter substrate-binding protein n=1 Tax=Robertmurraya korlensis TaxID=519977 RepID=UPI00203FC117|nr:glycine betaine ABC transporter substrate-binding protein [Robertmurraya korlensis]MCM3601999.1 glycine betaine ABC transporter substrate-binding protein [Robertmurraya korlensis]
MKKLRVSLLLLLTFILLVGCSSGASTSGETGDSKNVTINFGVTPWTSTIPPTKVAKLLLEDMGYTVKETSADAGGVYTGLSKGDLDVFMDAWLPEMHANYMEKYADSLDDTAVSYADGELGWVIPTYVKGIESVEDLKGKEDLFGGKVYGIEEGAGMTVTSHKIIEELGLDLEYVASSEGGMLAQVQRLMAKEEPVLFLGWRPHPMFANYDLKVLSSPEGYFDTSEVHVITNNELKDKAPEAYELLNNWSINVSDIEKMIVEIEDNNRDAEEVAQEWIDNHPDEVKAIKGEK